MWEFVGLTTKKKSSYPAPFGCAQILYHKQTSGGKAPKVTINDDMGGREASTSFLDTGGPIFLFARSDDQPSNVGKTAESKIALTRPSSWAKKLISKANVVFLVVPSPIPAVTSWSPPGPAPMSDLLLPTPGSPSRIIRLPAIKTASYKLA